MKIKQIRAFPMKPKAPPPKGDRGRDYWGTHTEVAGPMSRYPRFKRHRSLWRPTWPDIGCVAIAEDGTWGFGDRALRNARGGDHQRSFRPDPARGILPRHREGLSDMMGRAASPYSAGGLASYAISAVDLALWDLKGKILRPAGLRAPRRSGAGRAVLLRHRQRHRLVHGARLQGDQARLPLRRGRGSRGARAERGARRAGPRDRRSAGRADARLLDGLRRRVHRPDGRAAAALRPEVDRGLPDPRGHRRLRRGARAACPGRRWRPASTGTRRTSSPMRRQSASSTSSSPTSTGRAASPAS